jgi:hypothetical protein
MFAVPFDSPREEGEREILKALQKFMPLRCCLSMADLLTLSLSLVSLSELCAIVA